jgi:prepilin-type N-terminal cleavage/methylation domain-containing protein/prepilin-type processing-associated H-X9-DG protein
MFLWKKAFTLVEMLVVMAIIALLMGILMPALCSARSQCKAIVCRSNLRQLVLANTGYAMENDDFYVPAAEDILEQNGGLHRWHGVRKNSNEPFDPLKGPLVSYLADGKVKECPERVKFIKADNWDGSYEKGCGGYGYNATYLGSRHWQAGIGWEWADKKTTRISEVRSPSQTLMFADCAMSKNQGSYIETSFAWQPFIVYGGMQMNMFMSATIHFRHRDRANIGWVDGHISAEQMAEFDGKNVYLVTSREAMLGWFNPLDNSLFDLQ